MIKFDKAFEENILAKALKDLAYLKKASRLLDAHHFGTSQLAWVWKNIRSIWDEYREQPTKKLLLARVRHDFDKPEERTMYADVVRKLVKKKPAAASATLDELSNFVRAVNAQLALEEAAKHLEKNNLDKAYTALRQVANRDMKPREYTHLQWIEGFGDRQAERKRRKEHPDDHKEIPTGFKRLDRIIGGIQPGELGLILATTGKGKSISLNNIAYHAVKKGYNVVYFALEMPARQVAARQDARWLGITYNKFKNYDFTPDELRAISKRLKKVKDKWKDKLHIVSMPIRSADINTIRNTLDDLNQDFGFVPDLILMDSGDHLNASRRYESFRLEQSAVYWDLKGLAEDEGYAIWSSTHAGREWADSVATAESTGESYDKARIADIVMSLNSPDKKTRSTKVALESDDEDDGEADISSLAMGTYIELFIAKYRDGASRVSIPMDADFSRMLMAEMDDGK